MTSELHARIESLRQTYAVIGGPAADQWAHLLTIPGDRPVTLVNLLAFREAADYGDGSEEPPSTGEEAFQRYAAVSAPGLDAVGGRFVHVGSHVGNLVGANESWDLVVVGEYPNVDALLALHEDADYQEAYRHRVAACAEQRVLVSA